MKPRPHVKRPEDAEAREQIRPVLVYPDASISAYDEALCQRARLDLTCVNQIIVPPRDARAIVVPKGHFFRIVSVEGSQVGDLNLWNAHNLDERFYFGKTRALHGTHLGRGDRMWSSFPFLRPMATVTWDTLD
jgi:uncharacterized protein YcgI (DUF1989 family)